MDLRARLSRFGIEARGITRLHGGDLSEVFRVETSDGTLVAKSGPRVGIEAGMLRTMAELGAPVPEVLHISATLMVIEDLPEAAPTVAGWQTLGAALRQMHDRNAGQNGWPEDYAFGPVPLDNRPTANWPEFWAERRILPFAEDFPNLAPRLERLARRLANLLPHHATGLLHGDLWSGNVHFSTKGAFFIDPACYHGHGEVDLAMLHLFGTPPEAFWQGYGTPAPDWKIRRAIYQLFPALVHLKLFGTGYHGLVERCLSEIR
ncbi:fructosamine kinase family protein [Celeribacter persicus]|uniref:Fructosamine-3-kinase n=1 Tax=Celeribacter persicus TaxID=1651082 RepID=A0A2T5HMA8_9RHOB|nr:fructosamine kinase family protein [Celeribacter persicus]PTQ72718.1 fructosamine-3-kinase [Celeribacter persicus]